MRSAATLLLLERDAQARRQRERRELHEARRAALAQLLHEVDPGLSARDLRTLGWPSPEGATRTITRFGHTMFGTDCDGYSING